LEGIEGIYLSRQKEIMNLIKSLYKNGNRETLSEQILVLVYEIGDLTKSITRMIWYPNDDVMYKAYRAEAKKAIGDIITQLYLTCEYLDLSYDEVKEFGFKALEEKVHEWKKKGVKKV